MQDQKLSFYSGDIFQLARLPPTAVQMNHERLPRHCGYRATSWSWSFNLPDICATSTFMTLLLFSLSTKCNVTDDALLTVPGLIMHCFCNILFFLDNNKNLLKINALLTWHRHYVIREICWVTSSMSRFMPSDASFPQMK
jgi:hypothetical protein